jgi:type VII secretion-associated protein (TIGR03931 family)
VQVGAAAIRVAGADPGRGPRLLAELPAGAGPREVLQGVLAVVPAELVVVHPTGAAPPTAPAWAGLADSVRAVPAATAAAGARPRVVVDAGHTGAEVALLGPGGRPLVVRRCAVGGARLDQAVGALLASAGPAGPAGPADARRVREALSLLPRATARLADGTAVALDADGLRAALRRLLAELVEMVVATVAAAPTAPPVLLVGGVARTPLLAELLDAAGVADVTVAPRPETAAVLGALRLPAASTTPVADAPPVSTAPPRPSTPRERPVPRAALAAGGTGTAAALLVAGVALVPAGPEPATGSAGLLAQYGYVFTLPSGWAHTGGLPERRRVLLTRTATPDGSDLVAVERTPLGYDAAAEPDRAAAELRAEFDAAVAAGAAVSAFQPAVRVAGRSVATYRQRGVDGWTVEWFVVLDRDAQLSVGCQATPAGVEEVRRACEVVVGSVRLQ